MYKFNFYDYDYEISRDCFNHGCDGVCRCSRYSSLKLNSIDVNAMIYCIKTSLRKNDKRKENKLFLYCLERLCNQYTVDCFSLNVVNGYYGEEINGVVLDDESLIEQFLALNNPTEWVEFYLKQEYGYVLEDLKNLNWIIEKVDLKYIVVPNTYRKLNRKTVEKYCKQYKNDFLSCLTDCNYKLIDGYHRVQASKELNKQKIWCVRVK